MFKDIFKHKILTSTSNDNVTVLGLNKQTQANYVWNLFCVSNKNILVITDTLYEANSLYKGFYDTTNVLLFPMDDFLVSEAIATSPDLMVKRIETLNELVQSDIKKIVITNLMGYLRFLPTPKLWNSLSTKLKVNDEINRDELLIKLNTLGYKKESIVTKTGEYANRGYILDIFLYGYDFPIRIEFFDNQIDEIRLFDPNTQISIEKCESINIVPFTEFINEKYIDDVPNRQSLLPVVAKEVAKLADFIDDPFYIFQDYEKIHIAYNKLLEETFEFKVTDPYKPDSYMHDFYGLIPNKYIDIASLDNISAAGTIEKYFSCEIDKFNGNYEKIREYIEKNLYQKNKVVVCLSKEEIIEDFIEKTKLNCVITNFEQLYDARVNIVKKKFPNGFVLNNEVYLTEYELYGKDFNYSYSSKFKYGSKIKDINKLQIGDYVVHADHGVGRYLGIVTLKSKNLTKDYLHIQYKNNDKLYIPVEKIELISKFSSKEGVAPQLNKLGGTDWAKQKSRVKSRVKDIAEDLIKLSAERKMAQGFSFYPDDEEQKKFNDNFEYKETPDQLKAYDEISKDMELCNPMDRLLCGDVGYGKTEIAFRAIFKAIKSGKQTALLCPTTILSKQHYDNAKQRFNGFGINIEVLNRFIGEKKKKSILEDLKNGKIDLIIGTHRLLSKDVVYKDLGLLVVDEEQRFGVAHKELIKQYKSTIDVLTLSATPIPRTLQMSLTGIRGLSLIETPPVDRYPIQTYVLRENEQIIKDAIYKELSRNGQVFILYNRVEKIDIQVSKIKNLIPEAKVSFIHGQMSKNDIENTMNAFVANEFNILICTTIIETGIDIQNVNTLIVIDADCFGLSQLYQIRGRIGRGKNIGYAYLMYNKHKELNEIAVKRLNAIKEFTELGSGYALAVRDLSIRGAGDILGAEQSGFIDSVGYDMYLRILNEEVNRLKGIREEEATLPDEKPFLQVSTHIEDIYAESEDLKIEIHKKINTINSYESFEQVKMELTDRFGVLNNNIVMYMQEELFQSLAKKKGVIRVEQDVNKISIYFEYSKLKNINIADFMVYLFKLTPLFDVTCTEKIFKVVLNTNNLRENYITYLIKMLDFFE